jgi:hypothetical protein
MGFVIQLAYALTFDWVASASGLIEDSFCSVGHPPVWQVVCQSDGLGGGLA